MSRSARAAGLLAGMIVDAMLGDPRHRHPVAAFGRMASTLESRLYADSRPRGAVYALAAVAGVGFLGTLAERPTRSRPLWRAVVTAAATWTVVGATSLAREGEAMADALDAGDLAAARARLPSLCGRDPAALDAAELARATVESLAENTCDAVVAPLLWGAVAGVPGLLAYRAINTLDAMVGHRTPRYTRFGWAAARLDDAANWLPARLTALLAAGCAPLVKGWSRHALAVLARDGARHPSPNAGRCEAAFAGALGVRLGGVNVYEGRAEHRPELGKGPPPSVADIRRAVRLARAVALAASLVAAGLAAGARR